MGQKKWAVILLALLLAGCAATEPAVTPGAQANKPPVEVPEQREPALRDTTVEEDEPRNEGANAEQEPVLPDTSAEKTPVEGEPGPEQQEEPSAAQPLGPAAGEPVDEDSLKDEAVALQDAPAAVPVVVQTAASGTLVHGNDKAVIDYSNTAEGYVMVQYTQKVTTKIKAQVAGPTTTYTYNLKPGEWAVFPLSDGNGAYKVTVYENVSGTKYAAVVSVTHSVTMNDAFAPFLHPNQYVDYAVATATIAKAAEITAGLEDALQKVKAVYEYVVESLTYDKEKAAAVQSGYLPVLDDVLATKKGICFDYAALMTGMLRSQGIPSKLVVGYAGETYHAWISVWTEESGWMDSVIYFDGSTWKRMDPTFASSGKQSESIMEYIGDGKNYTAKYFY